VKRERENARLLGKRLRQEDRGVLLLIDPDRHEIGAIRRRAESAAEAGVAAILIGSSFLESDRFDEAVRVSRVSPNLPVVLFPGSGSQLSAYADGILLLSLISGRNPELLIGEHVRSAHKIKRMNLEVLPTGYMLVESGAMTSVQFMSNTVPLPRAKPELAAAHALAGQLLGLGLIYMDAGSGARYSIPPEFTGSVAEAIDIPLLVGGGIRTPEAVEQQIISGATMVVVGTAVESATEGSNLLREMVAATQQATKSIDRSITYQEGAR
jgi:putative glycerol-1-phosphate prenyltransferase